MTARTYDAISEGESLPTVQRTPTNFTVLKFIGAAWQWGPQFFDPQVAHRMALEGPIVPGPLKIAFMEQFLRRWLGGAGTFRHIQLSHRRPDYHDAEMSLGGAVTRKYQEDGVPLVDFEIWIDNAQGERSVRGIATIAFD